MRIGVTSKGAYVAPKTRRRGGSPRPNLATNLMNQAMLPALDDSADEVVARLERMLDRLDNTHGF
jgi:hypothetical protein